MTFSQNSYTQQAQETLDFLSSADDLSPRNPRVNQVLSAFVRATMQPRQKAEVRAILQDNKLQDIVPTLRQLCGRAEYEMERFAASAMANGHANASEGYRSFPRFIYRDNYEALVDLEINAIKSQLPHMRLSHPDQSVAFVGAGPLPISAILLHLKTGWPVTCIDSDTEACAVGKNLIAKLDASEESCAGIKNKMRYVQTSGQQHDYKHHPLVIIASLVQEKDSVLSQINQTAPHGTTALVRSAEGLSTLLYEPYTGPCNGLRRAMKFLGQTETSPSAINTSLVYTFNQQGHALVNPRVAERPLQDQNLVILPRGLTA